MRQRTPEKQFEDCGQLSEIRDEICSPNDNDKGHLGTSLQIFMAFGSFLNERASNIENEASFISFTLDSTLEE